MKKKIFLLVVLLLMLVGCKEEKFYVDDNFYENATITDITVEEFTDLENNKNNFLLFVYLPGCTSCAKFSEVITEFHKENSVEIYSISIAECENTSLLKNIQYAPAFFIFKDGKIVDYLDATSDKDKPALTTVDGFTSWLDEYIYLTK